MTGRAGKAEEDRQNLTIKRGQTEQGVNNCTAEKESQNSTAEQKRHKQDRQKRMAELDRQNRPGRAGVIGPLPVLLIIPPSSG